MFHMFFCFNLKPGCELEAFRKAYEAFTEDMRVLDLVESTSPIGERQSDTILDTDTERNHRYFSIMTFRDRAQADAAVDLIRSTGKSGAPNHFAAYAMVTDPIFICWQDT